MDHHRPAGPAPAPAPPAPASILIVGAGPTGLTLACELARRGTPFRIIDRKAGPTDESRALGVQARTVETLFRLGVAEKLVEAAKPIAAIAAYARTRRIARLMPNFHGFRTPYPHLFILEQSHTERLLVEALEGFGGSVEWGTSLERFEAGEYGVDATWAGPEGRSGRGRVDWLVGTDGARSAVRKGLQVPFEGAEYPDTFLLADVKLEWDRPDDEMTITLTTEGPIVAFPMSGKDRYRLVDGSGRAADDAEPARVVDRFQSLLRANGRPEACVTDPTWTSAFKVHRRIARHYRSGRALLLGDAAHIHSPAGGQGMNTGIQDAANLGWKLDAVARGAAPSSLLDSFELERRPVAAAVLAKTDRATRLVTIRNRVGQEVRDELIKSVAKLQFMGRKVAEQLSELAIAYEGSPIVLEDRPAWFASLSGERWADLRAFGRGLQPGDRVPDFDLAGPEGTSTRLHEVLRSPNPVLLAFQGVADRAEMPDHPSGLLGAIGEFLAPIDAYRVARPGSVGSPAWSGRELGDPSGEAHLAFGAHAPCLYLIRPDGYVGYRSMPIDLDRLRAYLGKIYRRAGGDPGEISADSA